MRSMYDLYKVIRRRNKYKSLNGLDRLRYTHELILKEKDNQQQTKIDDFKDNSIEMDLLVTKKNKLLKI